MMNSHAINGALAIMVAANAIADFELTQRDDDVQVRVWPHNGAASTNLHQHLDAMLSGYTGGRRLIIINANQ